MTRLAHLSDTHLGYEAYSRLSPAGNNQRGEDVIRAWRRIVDEIVAADPPLVVHSGDVADTPRISNAHMLEVLAGLRRLADRRPDGSRRQVVVVAGNHEQPRSRRDRCFLELFAGQPGLHVVTRTYETIHVGAAPEAPGELAGVHVHALPHDTLRDLAHDDTAGFDAVAPRSGARNVLVAHGVAKGSDLYVRSLGREYAIPTSVLTRDWHYVALGHWHKQGPVPVGGRTHVWYAGSSETMGFGDLLENGQSRGWLEVDITDSDPTVTPRPIPTRPIWRLAVVDAAGMRPESVTDALMDRLRKAEREGRLAGAVIGQLVIGISRDLWGLVDTARIRAAAGSCLHYELSVRFADGADAGTTGRDPEAGLDEVLRRRAETLDEQVREPALRLARELVAAELRRGPGARQ